MTHIANCSTYNHYIYIAGDYEEIKQYCHEYCDEIGLCVTVTKTCYVFTKGEEEGVIIGLINYPRFPAKSYDISANALGLAIFLLSRVKGQLSCSVATPTQTFWFSNRPENNQG